MSDTDQGTIDLDALTDDEVNALTPEQVESLMSQEQNDGDEDTGTTDAGDDPDNDASAGDEGSDDTSADDDDDPNVDGTKDEDGQSEGSESTDDDDNAGTSEDDAQGKSDEQADAKPEGSADSKDTGEPEKTEPKQEAGDKKAKEDTKAAKSDGDTPAVDAAVAADFYTKITAPFKADGRDMQVKSAEDAIRLMQMGANYSRRMQEFKPLKATAEMLKTHGLDDPIKLSQLIDVSKGDKDAIQKLLKDNNIDPLDIDVSKDSTYKAKDYRPDDKVLGFKEAIQETMRQDGGRDLITEINNSWDDQSKDALQEYPELLQNVLEQRQSGVYEQINAELEYQRSLGYMTNVPFLQAYHQVGAAMQKAGVWDNAKQDQSTSEPAPIDTGTRKAAQKPKTEQPNPHLSSNPPKRPSAKSDDQITDYAALSDDDFLKLPPPS